MKGRSIWTGEKSETLQVVDVDASVILGGRSGSEPILVEPRFESALRRYLAEAKESRRKFRTMLAASILLSIAGGGLHSVWAPSRWLIVASLLLLAITVHLFPFPTADTIRTFGIRRSLAIVRWSSLVLVALAAWMTYLVMTQG